MFVFILEIKLFFGYIKMVMLCYCIVILVILFMFFFGYLEYLRFFWIIFGSIGLNGLVYTESRTKSINFFGYFGCNRIRHVPNCIRTGILNYPIGTNFSSSEISEIQKI